MSKGNEKLQGKKHTKQTLLVESRSVHTIRSVDEAMISTHCMLYMQLKDMVFRSFWDKSVFRLPGILSPNRS
jgi:hypothetical protein